MLAMHEAMLAYEATPGAADGSVGQFVARSEHPLVLSGTAKESADKLVEMPDAGDGKVAWMTMGEIVVKHVEVDEALCPDSSTTSKMTATRISLRFVSFGQFTPRAAQGKNEPHAPHTSHPP